MTAAAQDGKRTSPEVTGAGAAAFEALTACPLCGGQTLRDRGQVRHPHPARVAGVEIDLAGSAFHLLACRQCGFQFKSPMIPADRLLACYAAAEGDHWGLAVDPIQRNFDRVADAVRRHAAGRRILDVGCFNGAFLDYLGNEWDRCGVEPSVGARQIAGTRGVRILGETLDDLPVGELFDVIVSMDVLEHIPRPRPFFERLGRHLRPGGIFVATSGDTGAWSWRLQGARYWYCSYLPEHVSFWNRESLEYAARQSGMQSVWHGRMSHKRTAVGTRLHQAVKGVVWGLLLRSGWLGLPPLRRRFAARAGTDWAAASDHFIHVMRRG